MIAAGLGEGGENTISIVVDDIVAAVERFVDTGDLLERGVGTRWLLAYYFGRNQQALLFLVCRD